MSNQTKILTERFLLRNLTVDDVNERYLSWLKDADAKKFIVAASQTDELSDLKQYVNEKTEQADVLFLGIFDKSTNKHIGNIKYEPISQELGYAVMGVLIGDPTYRGKGVTGEVLAASAREIQESYNINQIVLGVSTENTAAIRAYEKVGFVISETAHIQTMPGTVAMVWDL